MDHNELSTGSSSCSMASRKSKRSAKIRRAYKACVNCRVRKTRCNISEADFEAGRRCSRCRREMRECRFPASRQGPTESRQEQDSDRERHLDRVDMVENDDGGIAAPHVLVTAQRMVEKNNPEPSVSNLEAVAKNTPESNTDHGDIGESMMRTIVANDNDALNLLFETANNQEQQRTDLASGDTPEIYHRDTHYGTNRQTETRPLASLPVTKGDLLPSISPKLITMSTCSAETLETWTSYRFVKAGWFSAIEAVTYIDLFFQNLSPLSPVLDDHFSDHANHFQLVTREPLLVCMMLTISSRCHVLPVAGGEARGHLVHHRLWEHTYHLLMRILLAQEKGSKAKTRTLGSIEALLLLTEWQPRGLYVPPAPDGWDSSTQFLMPDRRDQHDTDISNPSRTRWKEDVIEPARRFEQMSWMAMGCAMSLAHELGVFDLDDADEEQFQQRHRHKRQEESEGGQKQTQGQQQDCPTEIPEQYERRLRRRRTALAYLLYAYQEQLAIRLGRKSIMPQMVEHGIESAGLTPPVTIQKRGENWPSFMASWIELIKLVRSISDLLFPSPFITQHLLQSGRYIAMIEHFEARLSSWSAIHLNHSTDHDESGPLSNILLVEYHHARIYANSLGLQAAVQRALDQQQRQQEQKQANLSRTDYGFIQTVIASSLEILQIVIKLHHHQPKSPHGPSSQLGNAPLTFHLRVTTASVFLLKSLGLAGASETRLRDSLHVLSRAIACLEASKPDDLHLGARYAELLRCHVERLEARFAPMMMPIGTTTATTGGGGERGERPTTGNSIITSAPKRRSTRTMKGSGPSLLEGEEARGPPVEGQRLVVDLVSGGGGVGDDVGSANNNYAATSDTIVGASLLSSLPTVPRQSESDQLSWTYPEYGTSSGGMETVTTAGVMAGMAGERDTSNNNNNHMAAAGGDGGGSLVDDESWLALPFDPSLLPFMADDSQDFQCLGDGSLDFIWNLT